MQYPLKEKAKGADRLIDAGVGQFLLLNKVQQVGLYLSGIEPIRGAAVVFRQSRNPGQVGLACA